MTNGPIKPSIQAALDEGNVTIDDQIAKVLQHTPSIAGSHRRPGEYDVFDPQDAGMEGIPLSYLSPSTADLKKKLDEIAADNVPHPEPQGYVVPYGAGFDHTGVPAPTHVMGSKVRLRYMDFGAALLMMEQGYRLARKTWGGAWIEARFPEGEAPCIYKKADTVPESPWIISQEDVMARDWSIVQ